jgi:predicted nucleotide-binding protein (sugar kinase/HSP70/actin superfamily)
MLDSPNFPRKTEEKMITSKKKTKKRNLKRSRQGQPRTVNNTRGSTLWSFNYFRQNILTNLLDDLYDLESTGLDDKICNKIQAFLEYFGNAATDIPEGGFMTGPIYKDIEKFTNFYVNWNKIKGEDEESRQKRKSARLKLKEQRQAITNKARRLQYELDNNLDQKLLEAGYRAIGDLTTLVPDLLNNLTQSFNEFVKRGGTGIK